MKRLIVGPWSGEFGWELFAWQAYIRTLAKEYDHTTIISRPASEPLYADFCDRFVEFTPSGGLADAFFMHGFDPKTVLRGIIQDNGITLGTGATLFLPRRLGFPPHTHYEQLLIIGEHVIKPEYVRYGSPDDRLYDFVFHIRSRRLREEDNWSIENWQSLRDMFPDKKIACMGTKEESGWIEGTADLRNAPLGELFNVLHNAECAFGPSSGPMHLASLCGLPHVVWSIPANKIRYEENWNPLTTPVLFDSTADWHPTPEYVYTKFKEWQSSGDTE